MPSDINALPGKMDSLKSQVNGLGNTIKNMEKKIDRQLNRNYQNQLGKLVSKSTSQLR